MLLLVIRGADAEPFIGTAHRADPLGSSRTDEEN
jgi:hypothetical protein